MTPERRPEQVFQGLGVSPGIAVGPAYLRISGTVDVPSYAVAARDIAAEIARLDDAVARANARSALRAKARGMNGAAGENSAFAGSAWPDVGRFAPAARGARADRRERINAEAASRPRSAGSRASRRSLPRRPARRHPRRRHA